MSQSYDLIVRGGVAVTPHVCPRCGGLGRFSLPVATSAAATMPCHPCGGRGIVWEHTAAWLAWPAGFPSTTVHVHGSTGCQCPACLGPVTIIGTAT